MRSRRLPILSLLPAVLAGLLACGGRESAVQASADPRMDPETALSLVAPFLNEQNTQAGEADGSGPAPAGQAMGLVQPQAPACVTVGDVTPTSVTWTFTNCPGPQGWTWNGVLVISWNLSPDGILVKHDHRRLTGTKDGDSWTINGVRDNLLRPAAHTLNLSAEPGFTKTFKNAAGTTVYTYSLNLTADWSSPGERKLHGSWGLTPTSGDAVSARIPQASPLIWQKGANCCYPVSGTLALAKGARTGTFVFGLPCGSATLDGTAKTLPPCS